MAQHAHFICPTPPVNLAQHLPNHGSTCPLHLSNMPTSSVQHLQFTWLNISPPMWLNMTISSCSTCPLPGSTPHFSLTQHHSTWLNTSFLPGSTTQLYLTHHTHSTSIINSTLRNSTHPLCLAQQLHSTWLNTPTPHGSTIQLYLSQHFHSAWINNTTLLDSTLPPYLAQLFHVKWY